MTLEQPHRNTDLFFVTFEKTEKGYSRRWHRRLDRNLHAAHRWASSSPHVSYDEAIADITIHHLGLLNVRSL